MEIGDILTEVKTTGGYPKKVVAAVSKVVADEGGVGAVVNKLRAGGGDHASSWVGTGSNRAAEPKKVSAALGRHHVKRVAEEAGVSEAEAEHGIASALPAVIDKLTPDGSEPRDGGTGSLSELLSELA